MHHKGMPPVVTMCIYAHIILSQLTTYQCVHVLTYYIIYTTVTMVQYVYILAQFSNMVIITSPNNNSTCINWAQCTAIYTIHSPCYYILYKT